MYAPVLSYILCSGTSFSSVFEINLSVSEVWRLELTDGGRDTEDKLSNYLNVIESFPSSSKAKF